MHIYIDEKKKQKKKLQDSGYSYGPRSISLYWLNE